MCDFLHVSLIHGSLQECKYLKPCTKADVPAEQPEGQVQRIDHLAPQVEILELEGARLEEVAKERDRHVLVDVTAVGDVLEEFREDPAHLLPEEDHP